MSDEYTPPLVLVLRCECGCEEPAPVDIAEGETTDCAYCGEVATCEAADAPLVEVSVCIACLAVEPCGCEQ